MKSEFGNALVSGLIAVSSLVVLTLVVVFSINYIATRIEPLPVVKAQAPLRLASFAALIWFIEFCLVLSAILIDAKYKCFGFSSEAAMGGLYFVIAGPIVFIATWGLSRFFALPEDSRSLFTLGAKIGYFTSIAPFILMFAVAGVLVLLRRI